MAPNVLILGNGGREHALITALSKSPQAPYLWIAPGNAGCYETATGVELQADDVAGICAFVDAEAIDLVVVGPEAPLVGGIVDALKAQGTRVFGPCQAAAQLEASKHYAKQMMAQAQVPTAGFAYCLTEEDAHAALTQWHPPYVIKEDGLAGGKGVTIAQSLEEAYAAVQKAFLKNSPVVIEEFLEGVEVSVLAICDGTRAIPLVSAQDFKRVGEGDTGPNTGGMGAYAPVPFVQTALLETIQSTILNPMMRIMQEAGHPFTGILYAGLMIHPNGNPFVVEFNVRFGDPETQVVLPLLQNDIDVLQLLMDSAQGDLSAWVSQSLLQFPPQKAITVVLAAENYPGDYVTGQPIHLPESLLEGVTIFHAGTARQVNSTLHSVGGRVLNITAVASSFKIARRNAYQTIASIEFPHSFYRNDIAQNVN